MLLDLNVEIEKFFRRVFLFVCLYVSVNDIPVGGWLSYEFNLI